MMQLYNSPNSPYGRKARMIVHELGMQSRVTDVFVTLPADAKFRALNPLGKIPALILDDGSVIYDSRVICEYLDELGGGTFFPRASLFKAAEGRWRALTLQALGDGLADATVRRNQEKRISEDKRSASVIAHQSKAVETSLSVLERICGKFPSEPTIGELAVAAAIGYLDLRTPDEGWRGRCPNLARWLEDFAKRPSFVATMPPG